MVSATAWRWLRKRSKAKLWNVFTWGTVEPWGGPLGPPYVEHNVEPWGWRGWTSQPKMCQGVDHQICLKSVQWGFYPWQLPTLGPQKLWIYWLRTWEPLGRSDPFQIHFKSSSSSSYCWTWAPHFSYIQCAGKKPWETPMVEGWWYNPCAPQMPKKTQWPHSFR